MELVGDLIAWFSDPENWQGDDAISNRLLEHVLISASAMAIAVLIAVPIGLYIGHTNRGAFLAVSLANIGRAVPSFAVLVIALPLGLALQRAVGASFTLIPALIAMVLLAIPPIVTNCYVGLREVDRDLIEGARGMGMRGGEVLRRVELPIGLPVILAGLRTATVQVVATAALGAVIGGGGLGRYIIQGIVRRDTERLVAGALMVALLAILVEVAFAIVQRRVVSPGLAPRQEPGSAAQTGGGAELSGSLST